ncbi:restriction endonuclease subunit S [Rhizobium leguminosarum]|uniref:restriction endonuclease subunit S n=1 Tax=Rhizobium leguminosarum TaxID=384 RepID=UPI0015FE6A8B|nr:restriction endonuclease subunit S [Rhizobium leguminosarum]MBA8836649.1 type I restriction enzyme S subunit [Rhizobium leguminosarum]
MSGLPRGWVEATIGEVCDYVQRGKSPKYTAVSRLPVINQKCVRWSGIDERFLKFVDPEQWSSWTEERFLIPGDVLWNSTGTGTIGRAALFRGLKVSDRAVVDSHVTILRPGDAISGPFLHRFIQAPRIQNAIADMQSGTTNQVELNRAEIIGTALPLPPLAEQKRIVAKLDALNAKSARARAELARIETLVSRYKQAVLSKAFSGELMASEVSGWVLSTLGELALDVRYGTAEKCTYAPELTPVLRIPNVADGRIDLSDLKHALFTEKELKKLALVEGDLLVIRSNGSVDLVGRSAVVDSAAAGMLFAGYLIRIRLDLNKASPSFVQRWMQSSVVRQAIENAAKSTSGVNNVNSQQLQALQLQLPPLEEQHEIVRRIEAAFAKIDRLAAEARRALELVGRLDEAILAKGFRGELVPQDENDEPASSLLERIKQVRISQPPEIKRKAPKRQGKVPDMARTIVETLVQAKDWLNAQELFERCGVQDGSSTEDVEKLYRQLLELERQEKVEIEEVVNPSTGAKQGDRVRLRK